MGVSIPHRYGKNERYRVVALGGIVMFPFLIGTVRTKLPITNASAILMFPFLIGTVRTLIFIIVYVYILIGFHSS